MTPAEQTRMQRQLKALTVKSEASLESKLKTKVEALGGECIKIYNPWDRGWNDRLVLMAQAKVYFVEVKKPGKKPEPHQAVKHKRLKKLGFEVWVIDSDEVLNEFINWIK